MISWLIFTPSTMWISLGRVSIGKQPHNMDVWQGIWFSANFLLQLKIWAVEIVFSRLITLINYFVQLIEFILPEETQWEQGILSVSNSQNSPGSGIVRIKGWVLLRQPQQTNSPSPCWHNGHSSRICRDLLNSVLLFAWANQKFFYCKFDLTPPMGR